MVLLLAIAAVAAPPADPADYRLVNPRSIELFERDPTLMGWALSEYDSNRDQHLSIFEADKAARAFKAIADGDGDGQVTPTEYRSAVAFVVARWGSEASLRQ